MFLSELTNAIIGNPFTSNVRPTFTGLHVDRVKSKHKILSSEWIPHKVFDHWGKQMVDPFALLYTIATYMSPDLEPET
jgi:hypothetical protein